MTRIDHCEKFEKKKPDFFEQIKALDMKHNASIIAKMKAKRHDFDSFHGILAELEFGLFLDQFVETLEYDSKLNGKTPDWIATVNGQTIIVEVARLKNSADVEQTAIEDQQTGGMQFRFFGSKPQRIYGNVIKVKLEKYKELIKSTGFPFIIAVYNTFGSEVDRSDAAQLFYGKAIEYQYSRKTRIDQSETLFYSERFPENKSLLNGVLWLDEPGRDLLTRLQEPKDFIYWNNPNASNGLEKIDALERIVGACE